MRFTEEQCDAVYELYERMFNAACEQRDISREELESFSNSFQLCLQPSVTERAISTAARLMGRRGGSVVSLAKARASRRNAQRGGRRRYTQVNRARVGTKTWQIGEMMLRPEGCSPREAMQVVGWPTISLGAQAAMCGLSVVRVREGRQVRFFARR